MSMRTIFWIAGYPKSGTTWLRSLLTAFHTDDAKVDINALGILNAANRWLVDHSLGIETSDLGRDEQRALLPAVFKAWAAEPGEAHFVKTHDVHLDVAGSQPMFPPEITRGVIHIVRDPRDVAVSSRHYWGISQDEAIDALNNPNRWILYTRPYLQIPIFLSDWSSHAASWLDAPLPQFTLRYEDLLADTAVCFAQLLQFCGVEPDQKQIEQVVNACSFSNLQSQERQNGYQGLPQEATAPFFRAGQAGGWKSALTPAQEARIVKAHGAMMARLGYLN